MAGRWSRARDGESNASLAAFWGKWGTKLRDRLKEESQISNHRQKRELHELFDPSNFLPWKVRRLSWPKSFWHFPKHTSSSVGSCAAAFPMRNWLFPAKMTHPDVTRARSHPAKAPPQPGGSQHQALAQGDDPQKILGPAGQRGWLLPSAQHWWSTRSSSGLQSTQLTWIYWNKSKGRAVRIKGWEILVYKRGWGCWNCLSGEQRLGMILHV